MSGQPNAPGLIVFDVTRMACVETIPPLFPPAPIIRAGRDFKVYGDFTISEPFGHLIHEIMAATAGTVDWQANYYAEEMGGANDVMLGTVSGNFTGTGISTVVPHTYTTPDTDLVVVGGITVPGTYRLTCTVTCLFAGSIPMPITGFVEGELIQIHA